MWPERLANGLWRSPCLPLFMSALGFQARADTPDFYVGAGNLSPGLHACEGLCGLSHLCIIFVPTRGELTGDVLFDVLEAREPK